MKKVLVFVSGVALGAYVMYSSMLNKIAKIVIDNDNKKEESSEKDAE